MAEKKLSLFIVTIMPLYFGWLLSFPYYGPVLHSAGPDNLPANTLSLLFITFHAGTYLFCGFLLKNSGYWYKLMTYSLAATLLTSLFLFLPFDWLWPLGMAMLGISSTFFILGWCSLYSLYAPIKRRFQLMAAVIIWANVIFIIFNLLQKILIPQLLLAVILVPLLILLVILLKIPINFIHSPQRVKSSFSAPAMPLIIICFFIIVLYLNGGLMYRVIMPEIEMGLPYYTYYRYLFYVLVVFLMFRFGKNIEQKITLYFAISSLGLAFISFAIFNSTFLGFMVTGSLIEGAFALLDLFVWTTLASLAFIYRAPFQFFGLGLAANTSSIVIGNIIGSRLLLSIDDYHFLAAALASSTIFISLMIMPWLHHHIEKRYYIAQQIDDSWSDDIEAANPYNNLKQYLVQGQYLTRREEEITKLMLQGLTNKQVANNLSISENTVKSHLKNIYVKFGVHKKRDLVILAHKKE